jgi:wobble nucleotide-excising tRNase
MIKKITIRNVASYDSEGVVLEDLQKVNIIYGGNGTGKTTISRFLENTNPANFTNYSHQSFDDCRIEWENGKRQEVLVYNQDFKKRNLTEDMPGLFTLGGINRKLRHSTDRMNMRKRELEKMGYDSEVAEEIAEQEWEKKMKESSAAAMQPTIERVNHELQALGYTGFRIQASTKQPFFFQIEREDGTLVEETLSEGEQTIITYLYYMQLIEGKKVAVIDDPMSSLDYDAIEVVSTLTNELIGKARSGKEDLEQVIVMTHNTTFHQSLSVRQPRRNTHYWKLYKTKGVSRVKACRQENPVKSEYKELWLKLIEENENHCCLVMPNLMRRIIETYFVSYGGYKKSELFAGKYCKNEEDRVAVKALAKWFDEGSHGVKDNMYGVNGEMMCERWMEGFRCLFEKMGQLEHYRMMMGERQDVVLTK